MRLLIDGTYLSRRAKGVGLYTRNVINHLVRLDSELEISVLLLETGLPPGIEESDSLRTQTVPWRNHLWHGFRTLPRVISALQPAVLWMPYETPMARLPIPFLMLCHDIPDEIRQAQEVGVGLRRSLLTRLRDRFDDLLLGKTLRRAEIVLSNSHYVAQRITANFDVSASRVRLAPCAPGADFESLSRGADIRAIRAELNLPHGYILCFYTGDPRENLLVVPSVYDRLIQAGQPQGLVIAGLSPQDRQYAEGVFASWPWRERVSYLPFFGTGERLDLARIYAAAAVYLDPSLQEGFGMQVIEAMASGTPVVCSDRGALPEVTGQAALLADPQDAQALANQILSVSTNPPHRAHLVEAGLQQARLFTWKRTAEVIHQSLLEVVRRT